MASVGLLGPSGRMRVDSCKSWFCQSKGHRSYWLLAAKLQLAHLVCSDSAYCTDLASIVANIMAPCISTIARASYTSDMSEYDTGH